MGQCLAWRQPPPGLPASPSHLCLGQRQRRQTEARPFFGLFGLALLWVTSDVGGEVEAAATLDGEARAVRKPGL